MADETNNTQAKIEEEDRALREREAIRDPEANDRDRFADGGSGFVASGEAEGEFAHQGEAALGGAMGGGPDGTGNTGGELPGGADSEFARTTGGQTQGVTAAPSFGNPATGAGGAQGGGTDRSGGGGSMSGTTGSMTSGSAGGQSVGTVGTVGSAGEDSEYGAKPASSGQGSTDARQHAEGGSLSSAGAAGTEPAVGGAGTDRHDIGSGSGTPNAAKRAQERGSAEEPSETEERSS